MTCHEVQTELSLYLYGELNFAREEAIEQHLSGCAFCTQALAREKAWHTSLNAEYRDVPLEVLSSCRRELKDKVAAAKSGGIQRPSLWHRFTGLFEIASVQWSKRLAFASFLVIFGFGAGRWVDRNGLPGQSQNTGTSEMSLFGPNTRVRDVQPVEDGRVRILIDQVREGEVTARLDDQRVRRLVFAVTRDANDPAIRVDSVEVLKGQTGDDVRDALIASAHHDANAAVRIKALEGLRRFSDDGVTRNALKYVLEHDENAGVRSEAIDILAPGTDNRVEFSPDLANTLEDIVRSERRDDYVRMRCLQVLQDMRASLDTY